MALAWHATIGRYPSEAAQRAAEAWDEKRFPSAGEFLTTVQAATRALAVEQTAAEHQAQMIGTPGGTRCKCDSGWVRVSNEGHGTVRRCERCGPVQLPRDEHKKGCTCMVCTYGDAEAEKIRAGGAWRGPQAELTDVERMNARAALNDMRRKLGKPEREYADVRPDASGDEWESF
jgi:hypothetical protein